MWGNNLYNYGQTPSPLNGFYCVVVQSEAEVQNYLVAANSTVLLISFNLKKFWLKGTDQNGIALPLREFEFNEKIKQSVIPQSNELESLKTDIANIKAMIESIKGGNAL